MPVVYDSDGAAQEVPDETATRLVQSGAYTLGPGGRVNARAETGAVSSVGSTQLDSLSTLRPYSAADEAADLEHGRLEREHDTVGSRARASLGGATDALSLGFVNPWQDDREFHPAYSGVGKAAGVAATLLVPGAGEESLARSGLEAAEGLGDVARGSRLARGIGESVGRTPLGLTARLAGRAGGLIEGSGLGARVARTALEGATGGGAIGLGTELSHQLLDGDAAFSGENLLGATLGGAALGGLIGAGGSLASEGLSAAGRLLHRGEGVTAREGMSTEGFAARVAERAPRPYDPALDVGQRPPLARLVGAETPGGASLIDGVTSRARDLGSLQGTLESLSKGTPGLLEDAGLTRAFLDETRGTVQRELTQLKSFSATDVGPTVRLAEDAHANDLAAVRLSRATDRVPARWADPQLREQAVLARDRALEALAARRAQGLPVSQAEEDAARYAAQLGVGRPPAEVEGIRDSLVARAARALVSRLPGGRLVASGLGAAGGVGVAEHVISHGVGHLLGHAALPLAAGGLAAKAVQAAFRDPHVGGLIAANAADVLNRTGVLKGNQPGASADPSRALRGLADRTRSVTPQQVMASTVASLGHVAGAAPLAVSQAGQAAANRHSQFLALLDRVDPPAATPGQHLLGRPLPSATDARRVADFVRMAGSPTNFLVAAMQGRLTPSMMAQAAAVWPATAQRARTELMSQLSAGGGDRLMPSQRRAVELVLGPGALGGPARSAAYTTMMAASVARASAPTTLAGGPRAGTVLTRPPAPTPAAKAASPGEYR